MGHFVRLDLDSNCLTLCSHLSAYNICLFSLEIDKAGHFTLTVINLCSICSAVCGILLGVFK